jgi:hypothetical protein
MAAIPPIDVTASAMMQEVETLNILRAQKRQSLLAYAARFGHGPTVLEEWWLARNEHHAAQPRDVEMHGADDAQERGDVNMDGDNRSVSSADAEPEKPSPSWHGSKTS